MTLNPTNPIRRREIGPTGDSFESLTADIRHQVLIEAAAAPTDTVETDAGAGGSARGIIAPAASVSVAVPNGATSVYTTGSVADPSQLNTAPGGAAVVEVDGAPVLVAGGAGSNGIGDTDSDDIVATGGGGSPGGLGGVYDESTVPFDPNGIATIETGGDAAAPSGVPAVGGDGADVDGDPFRTFDTADGFIAYYAGDDGGGAVVDSTAVSEATTTVGANTETDGRALVQAEPFVAVDAAVDTVLTGPSGASVDVVVDLAVRNIGFLDRTLDIDVSVAGVSTTLSPTIAAETTYTDTVTLSPTMPARPSAAIATVACDGETATDRTHLVPADVAATEWVVSHPDGSVGVTATGVTWSARDVGIEAKPDATTIERLRELADIGAVAASDGALGQFVTQALGGDDVLVRPPDSQQPPFDTRTAAVESVALEQQAPELFELSLSLSWTEPRPVSGATVGDGPVTLSLGDATISLSERQLGQRSETTDQRVRVDEFPIRVTAPVAAAICEHASHAGGAVIRARPFADAVAVDATLGDQLSASLSGSPIDSADLVLLGASVEQVAPTPTPRPYRITLRLARND